MATVSTEQPHEDENFGIFHFSPLRKAVGAHHRISRLYSMKAELKLTDLVARNSAYELVNVGL